MKIRILGKNGFEVSEIGLGCWQFGGDFGPISDETAYSIMNTSVENGVTFFDTADVYGSGKSEELIGRFLKISGVSVKIATKFGRGSDVYPDKYSEKIMKQSVEMSLRRLGVNSLDLVQLHCIPVSELKKGKVFDWLRDLKKEGMIKNFGASVESIDEGLICLRQEGLISLQVIFNIYRQRLADELFPKAKEAGVGIIVRLPLASGLLSGKFSKETKFAKSDHRNYNRDGQAFNVGETFAGIPFEKGIKITSRLKAHVPADMNMAQLALRWILDFDAVSTVIPGASSPNQAKANALVSEMNPISIDLHRVLHNFYKNNVEEYIRGPY